MRNRQMIVRWLMANTKAIEARHARRQDLPSDGRCRRRSATASAGCWPKCSASSPRATTPPRKKLFDTYGIHFDPKLRDEVVARVDALKLPSYTGFVMPKLTPVTGADGAITDVTISYPLDLTTQMLEYSGAKK